MKDERKTKQQLVAELVELRQRLSETSRRVATLEASVAEHTRAEERNRALYEFSPDGIVTVGLDGCIVECNQAYAEMLGYGYEELEGMVYQDTIPSRWHDFYEKVRQEAMARGYSYEFETECIRQDGAVFPASMRIWRIDDESGNPVGIWAIVRDITQRKKAEEELRRYSEKLEELVEDKTRTLKESGENFRSLAENASDGILISITAEGAHVYANKRAAEITGYSVAELLKICVKDLTHPDEFKKVLSRYRQRLVGEDVPGQYETIFTRKDGENVPIDLAATRTTWHGQPAVMIIIRDITERKQAEEALRESEREKAVILGNMREHVIYQDLDMRILWANRAAGESVGLSSEQLVGRYCYEVWNQQDEPCVGCPVVRARESGQTQEAEMTTPDGRMWLVRGYPIRDAEGRITNLVEVTLDITERKRAEEALRVAADRLSILSQIDRAILKARSPEEISRAALNYVQRLIPCQMASVAVFDPQVRQATILARIPRENTELEPGVRVSLSPFGDVIGTLQRGETYLINDLLTFSKPPPIVQAQQAAGVRAFACVPLIVQGELIGALNLSASAPGYFGEEQVEIAQELANHLAIVIQQAHLHEQVRRDAEELEQRVAQRTRDLERRTAQLQVAAEVARDAATAHNLDELLISAVDLIRERFGFYHAGIFLIDRLGEYAVLRAAAGEAGRQMLEVGHKLKVVEEGIVGHVTGSGQPRIVPTVDADVAHIDNPFLPETRSELTLPLKAGDRVIGALDVQSIHEAAFDEDDLATLQIMADQLAVAIERTRLFEKNQAALEERLRTVVANAPIVLFAMDREGIVTLAEGKDLEGIGIKPSEHVGQSIFDIYRDMPKVVENVHRALSGEAVAPVVEVGNKLFESWYTPVRDESGGVTGVIAVATDVTERERAEQALRESEEKYRLVSENIPVTVYSALPDEYSTSIFLSGRMEELTGYPPDQFLQDPQLWLAVVHPDDRAHVWKKIEEHRKNKCPLDVEYRIVTKNDTIKWVRDWATPMLDENGEILRINGFMEDITERKHLEEQMRLQERLAAVGQLAGGIAHDFNNFLTTIMLYAQILLRKSGLPQELVPVAETILEESRRAAELVRRILDFSRRSLIETRPVDLAPYVEETADILQRTLPENIHLLVDVGVEEYIVNADPARIQQVMMNLALNARDAMPDGGELCIGLSRIEVKTEDEPPVAEMTCGEWVCLTISDTGTGMTEEVQSHLFEPFFTTKGPKGTGLGLAQAYGVVKRHGGHIGVETQAGQGTTFRVYLVPHEATELVESQKPPSALPQGQGEIVLLVEDEDRVREAGCEILESLGYRVLVAADGQVAMQVYRSAERVDLVLTDLIMPEMGGKELAQELKKIDPRVKVLAITGYTLVENVEELKRAGLLDIVQKPFEVKTLARVVRRTLDAD
jgi:PAS domain S-box-containing protein